MKERLAPRGFDDDTVLLRSQLAETTLLLEVLAQVNALILTSTTFESFCATITKILKEKFSFQYIHIWIRDEKNSDVLRLVTPESFGEYRTTRIDHGIVGKCIREKRTQCVPDVRTAREYISIHPDTQSELCIPLRHAENVIGAINIESPVSQDFSHHLPILELIASNLGHSLRLAYLYRTEEKLHKTERFLASIAQHSAEAIVGLDFDGIIQSWNVGAEKIFGYKMEEIVGKSVEAVMPEERKAVGELMQILTETKLKGFLRNIETTRLHKNGKSITISLTSSAIRDMHGNIIGFSMIHRDITAQKKWERELQDRFDKMQEAYKEMGRQRRYLDYLMDIISLSTESGHQTKQVAHFIVNAMVMMTKVDAVTLRILEARTGKLVLSAHTGVSEEWLSKKSIPYSGSLCEAAVKKNHPLKILDVVNDSLYASPSLARKNNLRSALVLPLEAKGEVLGCLTLYLSQEGNLSLLDDEFIGIFAKQSAIALKLSTF